MLTKFRRWAEKHWRAILVSFAVSVVAGLLVAVSYDVYKRWIRPIPIVTRIAAEHTVVREGALVDVWAETLRQDSKPEKYYWTPENKIINNGQQRVTLKAADDERHTWPYTITVNLTPIDSDGTTLDPPAPITITVESEAQSNTPVCDCIGTNSRSA